MVKNIIQNLGEKLASADFSYWNQMGRNIATRNSEALTAFHEGRSSEPEFAEDPRGRDLAEKILLQVVTLNARGRAAEARARFDPAFYPFITEIRESGRAFTYCAILGDSEFLVQQETANDKTVTWHINDDEVQQIDNISGFAWSRNRQFFLTAFQDGSLAIGSGFGAKGSVRIAAPTGTDFIPKGLSRRFTENFGTPTSDADYLQLAVSDDGLKILLCDRQRGVLLLENKGAEWAPQLLFPSTKFGLEEQMPEAGEMHEKFIHPLDMLHAALSPDGKFVAFGAQESGHFIVRLSENEAPSLYATLGYISEYPHNACFSDDSKHVAFNSCHFYNGVTFSCELDRVAGLNTEPYVEHETQTILNDYLRVYASAFLPKSNTRDGTGAFLLLGPGFTACVTPKGELLWELGYGASVGVVDVCPENGRILIASSAGIVHLIDPAQPQSPMIFAGYNAPQELRRWIFWDTLNQPIMW